MWFLTQFRRWGLLRSDPDYAAVARRVNQIDLYSQAAAQVKVAVPEKTMRASRLMDGVVWDGTGPERHASAHQIHA
jgi:nitrate/nitrite transport system substrate-binding protein